MEAEDRRDRIFAAMSGRFARMLAHPVAERDTNEKVLALGKRAHVEQFAEKHGTTEEQAEAICDLGKLV